MFTMVYIFTIGMSIGLLIDMMMSVLNQFHITQKLYLIRYAGCQFTGTSTSNRSFMAGFIYSVIASGLLGLLYAWCIEWLELPLTMLTAIMLGSIKTVISGCIMPLLDRTNRCVQNNSIARLGLFGTNHGLIMPIILTLGNIAYVFIIVEILAH